MEVVRSLRKGFLPGLFFGVVLGTLALRLLPVSNDSDLLPLCAPPDLPSRPELLDTGRRSWRDIALRAAGPTKSIIVATMTSRYFFFATNLYVSLTILGRGEQLVFVAQEDASYEKAVARWPNHVIHIKDIPGAPTLEGNATGEFGSKFFRAVVDRKPYIIMTLLEMGLRVTFVDTDVVFLEDPMPFFTDEFDIFLQWDQRVFVGMLERFKDHKAILLTDPKFRKTGDFCTCLMSMKPSPATMIFMDRWINATETNKRNVTGQFLLNEVLVDHYQDLKVGILPVTLFPSGCIFFRSDRWNCSAQHDLYVEALNSGKIPPVVFAHTNWRVGYVNKLANFRNNSLWLLPYNPSPQIKAHDRGFEP